MAWHALVNFCRLVGRLWSFNGGPFVRYTPKRIFTMVVMPPVLFLFNAHHWLCLGLDYLLFPGFRRVEVREPVFIVGLQRSGTTFLHRVLSLDDQFTSMTLAELVFAPSVVQKKFWRAVAAVDRALGGFGRKAIAAIDRRIFEPYEHIHKLSLFLPEEDELVMLPTFDTIFHFPTFPFREFVEPLMRFDRETAPERRRRLMEYYKRCVQRHLYVSGPHKKLMSKNPFFTPKIASLRETFPDCRIICNVRTPYEAVASTFSLGEVGWKLSDNAFGPEYTEALLEACDHMYGYPMEVLPQWPENRHAFVRYPDLVSHPGDTIRALYHRLEIPLSEASSAMLDAEEAKARGYRSAHKYKLEEHGLSVGLINERYGHVLDAYGFERAGSEDSAGQQA
jgi:hypothetical protein